MEVQADALYRGRQGDNSHLVKLDACIAMVKSKIPKDPSKEYSQEEVKALEKEILADAAWYDG